MPRREERRRPTFLNSPVELIEQILHGVDFRCIVRCSLVCKRLHQVISDSVSLQYVIELGSAGLVDSKGKSSTSDALSAGGTLAERSSALVEFQARWRSFNPSSQSTHAFSGINVERFVYNDGVLTVSYYDQSTGEFRLLSYDTSTKSEWSYPLGTDFEVDIFETNPSQDLLVLVEYDYEDVIAYVDALALSTGSSHHLSPDVTLSAGDIEGFSQATVHIQGDLLAVYFWYQSNIGEIIHNELRVWNWKTMELLATLSDRDRLDSFAFLSNDAFVMASGVENGTSLLHLYKFASAEESTSYPTLLCSLELPPMHGLDYSFRPNIKCSNSSIPSVLSRTEHCSFNLAPSDDLLRFQFGAPLPRWKYISFFIHRRTLLFYTSPAGLARRRNKRRKKGGHKTQSFIAWEMWGIKGTRWLESDFNTKVDMEYRISGLKAVCFDPTASKIYVLDFSPSIMRNAQPAIPEESERRDSNNLITEPSTIDKRRLFDNDIVSTLPYHQSESPQLILDDDLKGFGIDVGKVLLCLNTDSGMEIRVFNFDIGLNWLVEDAASRVPISALSMLSRISEEMDLDINASYALVCPD